MEEDGVVLCLGWLRENDGRFMNDGPFVGPAMGFVGELARAKVTVKGFPSHPLSDRRSNRLLEISFFKQEEVTHETFSMPQLHFSQ
jgi:hypothetical protein